MLTNLFPPVGTGSSIQCSDLARNLARRGHNVIVFTATLSLEDSECERTPEGVEVYRLPCLKLPRMGISMNFAWLNSTMRPSNIARMRKIIRDRNVDVLHIHNHMFDMALNGIYLSRSLGIPAVVTMHTAIIHTNRFYHAVLAAIDRHFLGYFVIRKARAIICPDYNVLSYVSERFGRTDGCVIPYGISLPSPPADNDVNALREIWGLAGKRVILSLGHLHALRNRIDLVKAFARVVKRYPDVRLVFVGSRGYPPTEKLVRDLRISDFVVFTGVQPHELIPAYHSMAEFEAMWLYQQNIPSLGIACLEGMHYGKAIIACCSEDTHGAGGLSNGRNLINLPRPTDVEDVYRALVTLLDNPQHCKQIGYNAAQFIHSYFHWDKVILQHEQLYGSLVRQ